jgi:hypothetical protein
MQAAEFAELTRPLVGLAVSRPWRGHGTCVVLELGPLTRQYRGSGHPRADVSIMVEWSWRVESRGAVRFGSWSSDPKINSGIARLRGLTIQELSSVGRLPELQVCLSGNHWLHSFMTAEGQPEWTVFLPDRSWLRVRRGRIVRERPSVSRSSVA